MWYCSSQYRALEIRKLCTRGGDLLYKADPYAFHAETRPSNGSKVYDITGFAWHDDAWQTAQKKADVINGPMNIYEMHAGSWKLKDEKEIGRASCRERV